MTASASVRAQAKVNLFLRILARETSGYHGLETLFARLELADDITVRVGGRGRTVDCRGADTGPPEANLAFRAAEAFADATGWPPSFEIEIEKRIPVGGGLGGGSADAGGVLRALNTIAPTPLPTAALLAIAARLGADVPFLTDDSPLALAWGRGERMLRLPALPVRDVILICFPFGVSSAAAFGWVAEARGAESSSPRPNRLTPDQLASWEGVSGLACNDFEEPVGQRHPAIAELLAAARAGNPLLAGLTGSGSTIVMIPRSNGAVDEIGLPAGVTRIATRTAVSVEDVRLTR
jgi:4-diphosphocytidyl-2-C-methyl-D-erythritol kinase